MARHLHPPKDPLRGAEGEGGVLNSWPASTRSGAQHAGIGLIGIGVVWENVLAPNLVGWGFVLAGFLLVLLTGRQRPVRTPLDWPLLLLAAMAGISLLVTVNPETTQVQALRLTSSLAGLYGVANWANDRKRLVWGAQALIASGLGLALVAPFIVDWSRATSVPIPSALYRFFPLLISDSVHPNIMAGLLVLLSPLPLAWWLSPHDSKSNWMRQSMRFVPGVVFVPMAVMLVLTKSRGGYIAGALGWLATVWLSGRRRWAIALTLIALCLGGLLFLMEGSAPGLMEATRPDTWLFRLRVWQAALRMMDDFALTGIGMGTFNQLGSVLYALLETENPGTHNLYLQVGVDLGYPGLIAYLSMLILEIWMAIRAIRALEKTEDRQLRALTAGALAGIIALMSHGLVDMVAWGTRAAFVPWVVFGWVAAVYCLAMTGRLDVSASPATIQPGSDEIGEHTL